MTSVVWKDYIFERGETHLSYFFVSILPSNKRSLGADHKDTKFPLNSNAAFFKNPDFMLRAY